MHEGQQALRDGVGYVYPHDDPEGIVAQQYLPDGSEDLTVYTPLERADERVVAERLAEIDRRLGKRRR